MKQIVDHQFFVQFSQEFENITGSVVKSIILDEPNINVQYLFDMMRNSSIRTKLNAYDILYRYRSISHEHRDSDYQTVYKISTVLNNEVLPLFMKIDNIMNDEVKENEIKIINVLEGKLSLMTLYRLCENINQIKYLYEQILTNKIDYKRYTMNPKMFEQMIKNIN